MFYVYILYSKAADKFYVGQTSDVARRLLEHNTPIVNSKFTAKYIPWYLMLYFPINHDRRDTIKVEKFIKSQKSRKFIHYLISEKDNYEFFHTLIKNILNIG